MYNQIKADMLIWLEEQNQSKNQSQRKKKSLIFMPKAALYGVFVLKYKNYFSKISCYNLHRVF